MTAAGPPVDGEPEGSGTPPDQGRRLRLAWSDLALWILALAVGSMTTLGLAALLGEDLRTAVLVEVDRELAGSEVSYSDAPAEAARFFAERDSVQVRVPRDMSVAAFLSLYHLETNASARAALRDQLGAVADEDVLREGDVVSFDLTLTRPQR